MSRVVEIKLPLLLAVEVHTYFSVPFPLASTCYGNPRARQLASHRYSTYFTPVARLWMRRLRGEGRVQRLWASSARRAARHVTYVISCKGDAATDWLPSDWLTVPQPPHLSPTRALHGVYVPIGCIRAPSCSNAVQRQCGVDRTASEDTDRGP